MLSYIHMRLSISWKSQLVGTCKQTHLNRITPFVPLFSHQITYFDSLNFPFSRLFYLYYFEAISLCLLLFTHYFYTVNDTKFYTYTNDLLKYTHMNRLVDNIFVLDFYGLVSWTCHYLNIQTFTISNVKFNSRDENDPNNCFFLCIRHLVLVFLPTNCLSRWQFTGDMNSFQLNNIGVTTWFHAGADHTTTSVNVTNTPSTSSSAMIPNTAKGSHDK